jgi:hypothetical protein
LCEGSTRTYARLGGRLRVALGEKEDAVEAALDEMREDNYRRLASTGPALDDDGAPAPEEHG